MSERSAEKDAVVNVLVEHAGIDYADEEYYCLGCLEGLGRAMSVERRWAEHVAEELTKTGALVASAPKMATYHRYWPDGSYCANGRTHVTWGHIDTTADVSSVDATGTEGPVTLCGCPGGGVAMVAVNVSTPPGTQS